MRTIARVSWFFAPLVVILSLAIVLATPGPQAPPPGTDLFRNVARQQNPIVVAIMTRARIQAPSEGDDLFEWFFGQPMAPEDRIQRGAGSGFLVSRDGEILTNNHVVAGADVIEVGLFGHETKTYRATLLGRDPLSDSALIKLQQPPANLPAATLGDSDALEPGDWVMAIGNPFQLGHTVTVGVVSYQGRPFEVQEGRWQKMIQTDASINPGNSGGPLINVRGEVVGINAAILGGGAGGNIGIGFAIPINSIKGLLPLLRTGKVVRGRIGVELRSGPMTDDDARALGLARTAGAIVTVVERGSPASRGGVRSGDVIVALNGSPVADADDFVSRIASASPGSSARLTVLRDGRERTLDVMVEELPLDDDRAPARPDDTHGDQGITFGDITPAIARQLRLPADVEGAVIVDVEVESIADYARLQPGDIVFRVNRGAVRNAGQARQALWEIDAGQPAFLFIWRDGNEVLIQMRKE